jgi:hypothetical protein
MLFHGSNVIVENPQILSHGYYKDFGFGFYCTGIEKQAKRWALTKRKNHVINKYRYKKDDKLKYKIFSEMSDEWLQFVVNCRKGIKHNYDIVEGAMADDTIWDYIEDYVTERISKSAFWELVKFKYPTHQIAFCTEFALETIEFEGSYSL